MSCAVLDLSIAELVRRYPASRQLLAGHGITQFDDPETLATYGGLLKVRTLLKAQRIDEGAFCARLAAESTVADGEPVPAASTVPNLFALLPCPLKVPIEEAFAAFLQRLPADRRERLTFFIEGNANHQLDYADYADHFERLDEIPDIVITPGFNSFFHPHFVERFIRVGRFTSVSGYAGDRHLAPLGVIDPAGHYTMLAMNLLVPVVDRFRLGSRPVPRCWADLLDPQYRASIAIRGNSDGTFCETLLLAILKEFGPTGLEQLGRNVSYGWHPSQMAKTAGNGREEGPAISIMPLFFTTTIKNREQVEIVWPADGALVSPVTMLIKAEKRSELREVVDFLAGPEVARICAGALFPAVHPEVDNRLPDNATFKWIGWDYVTGHDLKTLIAQANEAFRRGFRRSAE